MGPSRSGRVSALIVLLIVASVLRIATSINPLAGIMAKISAPLDTALAEIRMTNDSQFITDGSDADALTIRQLQQENDDLRSLVEGAQEESVLAKVLRRDMSSIRKHIWVSVGSSDGLELHDPVMHNGFLVGLVDEVFDSSARIQLIIDAEFRLTVEADRHHGLLTEEAGSVVVKHIDNDELEGAVLRTDGLANRIRPGLPVGEVGVNATKAGDVLQSYAVRLYVSPYDIDQVEVLTDGVSL